jgi:hypothetical protein
MPLDKMQLWLVVISKKTKSWTRFKCNLKKAPKEGDVRLHDIYIYIYIYNLKNKLRIPL